ncbi:hypothetical protein B0J12DRAFT_661161 [Macrophomina phaseolina]|uniref:N-acetylgalactosaminide beta-1,3-galactosyltransferase n=1 Tax=Macrophomina phaseolina TaxID=35725 RepID=A0ABQ8GD71_9PEZI|nr:hypothetical protein B0J12DRAFT_661161 [Macrophomina phaseolina]
MPPLRPQGSHWARSTLILGALLLIYLVLSLQILSLDDTGYTLSHFKGKLQEHIEKVAGITKALNQSAPDEQHTADVPHPPPCQDLPGAENILVILKTGATEIYQKLPAHLLATLRCASDVLLVSDYEQDIGGYHIHDILAELSPGITEQHPDFALYREQRQWGKEFQEGLKLQGGWQLDKYKFLPMARKAYEVHPDKKWYLFMEADTYMVWTNLLAWLDRLNHTQPLYLGGRSYVRTLPFAHGGSGFVISQPALKRLHEVEPIHREAWQSMVPHMCCGDAVLGAALLDADVPLTPSQPGIQSEPPSTIQWTADKWCTVALSWHHLTSAEVDALWQFEQDWMIERGKSTPIFFSEYFDRFVEPYLQPTISDWDNLSEEWVYNGEREVVDEFTAAGSDVTRNAHRSASDCRNACIARHNCLQYSYEPDICRLSSVLVLGKPDNNAAREIESGWLMKRIKSFRSELEPCDPERGWVVPGDWRDQETENSPGKAEAENFPGGGDDVGQSRKL